MKNKFFAALLVGMAVLGAAAVAPAEAKGHDRAANLAAMQMYAQQMAQQGQGPLAQQWGTPYYNNANPYGAYNYANPYSAYNPYAANTYATNPYATNPYATNAYAAYGVMNPYAVNPYGVNAYNPYANNGYYGYDQGFFGQNPYQQTGWRGQLSSILNGWF